MKTKYNGIFISYRRDGGFETTKHLNNLLVHDGYAVSFDIDTSDIIDVDAFIRTPMQELTTLDDRNLSEVCKKKRKIELSSMRGRGSITYL